MRMLNDIVTRRLKLSEVYPGRAKALGVPEDAELIRKTYKAEIEAVDEEERTVTGVINTKSVDRDGEIVEPQGAVLDDYEKNRVVLFGHDYHGLPVGDNVWIKNRRGVGLVAKTRLATEPKDYKADWLPSTILHLFKIRVLKAFSIGFVPLEWKDIPSAEGPQEAGRGEGKRERTARRIYTKWLLLEYSIVPVPSNPDALLLAVKSGDVKDQKVIDEMGITPEDLKAGEAATPPAKTVEEPPAPPAAEEKKGEKAPDAPPDGKGEEIKWKLCIPVAEKELKFEKEFTGKVADGVFAQAGWTEEGEKVLRSLEFEMDKFDDAKAAEWMKAYGFLAEIIGDAALEDSEGGVAWEKVEARLIEERKIREARADAGGKKAPKAKESGEGKEGEGVVEDIPAPSATPATPAQTPAETPTGAPAGSGEADEGKDGGKGEDAPTGSQAAPPVGEAAGGAPAAGEGEKPKGGEEGDEQELEIVEGEGEAAGGPPEGGEAGAGAEKVLAELTAATVALTAENKALKEKLAAAPVVRVEVDASKAIKAAEEAIARAKEALAVDKGAGRDKLSAEDRTPKDDDKLFSIDEIKSWIVGPEGREFIRGLVRAAAGRITE